MTMVDQQTEDGPDAQAQTPVPAPAAGRQVAFAITDEQLASMRTLSRRVLREPFTGRPWSELAFYLLTGGIAFVGLAFVMGTLVLGVILAITVFGLAILAASIRAARGF